VSYYMGDYYRGDPGIGSFFGGLVKRAVGAIPGVGPIATGVMDIIKRPAAASVTAAAKRTSEAIVKHPVLSAAGAAGALGTMAGAGAVAERMMGGGGARVRGMHPCKNKKHGCKHGAMVPNRRMNPFNPRAARRASRRLHSLVRHYRKYIGFVSAHRPKGRPYIKARKRK
jgi:hypothetical protein